MASAPAPSAPDRVQVWASQLAANDFPPVCAMTGQPVETWRKFRFSTPPPWAYALLALLFIGILGLIIAASVMNAVSLKATGYLPLTRRSRQIIDLAVWLPIGLILGSFAVITGVVIAAMANVDAADANAGGVAGISVLVAAVLLTSGLILRLVVTPLVSIRAHVTIQPGYYDRLVEIRHVHPAFVAAVIQRQQARAAQYAPVQPPASIPLLPGSN